MKYRFIIFCLLTCICTTLWADDFPSVMPFRSTTSYWENQPEIETPARTGFRAIATAPFAIGEDGITYMPSEMATASSPSPRRSNVNPNPPDEEDDKYNGAPIGDMLLPLLLLSAGYALYVSFRRKKSTCTQK